MKLNKLVIGRTDIADFPLLHLADIEVKVDTGAYTSSFHCHDIETIEEKGIRKLKCRFLDPGHEKYHHKTFIFENFTLKKVKSSNGAMEKRYAIITEIVLFDQLYQIELTLTERGSMKFPVLLGRKFLVKKFVVDPALSKLSQKGKVNYH